jgi:hypothetical protein
MSSYWNYRVLARKVSGETEYSFYEVHYENDIPIACTENPIYPLSLNTDNDPIESLVWLLYALKVASGKPILDYDNFPKEYVVYSRKMKLKMIEKFFPEILSGRATTNNILGSLIKEKI